jgi:hypothetical protein
MFPEVGEEGWVLVCEGEIGDMSYWESGFEVFGEVASVLNSLEGVQDEIDWSELIGSHSYFSALAEADFPPLYNEDGFETWLDGFLFIPDDDEDKDYGRPGTSFQAFRLYVDRDKKAEIVNHFKAFLSHLKSLPLVRRVLGDEKS